ncbi:MAG: Slp family lipoprotein [Pseudoxanthomonas sp.]
MNTQYRLVLIASALALGGCATTPAPLVGAFPDSQPMAGASINAGNTVRWGGTIVETQPGPQQTCFQVLSRQLDSTGRPDRGSAEVSDGRFLACRSGFYDPAVFSPGREVTFVGQTAPAQPVKIGEFSYNVPRLEASVVYLWPVRPNVVVVRDSPWDYGPYWGPYWGPWGRWGWW